MKSLVLLPLCFTVVAAFSSAQTSATPPKCDNSEISTGFGPEIASKAQDFVIGLQKAVHSNDRDAVASMMHYPLRTTKIEVKTKAQFLKRYDELWTADVKSALFNQSIACLPYASSGYTPESGSQVAFAIGPSGQIWYWSFGKDDAMKVITINN